MREKKLAVGRQREGNSLVLLLRGWRKQQDRLLKGSVGVKVYRRGGKTKPKTRLNSTKTVECFQNKSSQVYRLHLRTFELLSEVSRKGKLFGIIKKYIKNIYNNKK